MPVETSEQDWVSTLFTSGAGLHAWLLSIFSPVIDLAAPFHIVAPRTQGQPASPDVVHHSQATQHGHPHWLVPGCWRGPEVAAAGGACGWCVAAAHTCLCQSITGPVKGLHAMVWGVPAAGRVHVTCQLGDWSAVLTSCDLMHPPGRKGTK